MASKHDMIEAVVTVRGTGRFPLDMLRYDRLTPATEIDSGRIETALDRWAETREATEVKLLRRHKRDEWPSTTWQPTVGRWNSFGWAVMSVEYKDAHDYQDLRYQNRGVATG